MSVCCDASIRLQVDLFDNAQSVRGSVHGTSRDSDAVD